LRRIFHGDTTTALATMAAERDPRTAGPFAASRFDTDACPAAA